MTSALQPAYDCGYCDGVRTPEESFRGAYCSPECFYKDKGESILTCVDSDGTRCSTCFKRVRDIEEAREDDPDNYHGRVFPTEHTEFAVGGVSGSAIMRPRMSCGCGSLDTYDPTAGVRESEDPAALARRLYVTLTELFERDAIQGEPDHERFIEGWRRGGVTMAAGMACYD